MRQATRRSSMVQAKRPRRSPGSGCILPLAFGRVRPDNGGFASSFPGVRPAMNDQPSVILSAFSDEAAYQKTAVQQFAALAAIGLEYYSLRFVDVGNGI